MSTLIKIDHLSKNFGDLEVLRDVSIDVQEGEVICVIGPSGSGKSTMLRCINQLEVPTSGRIIYDGKDLMAGEMKLRDLRELSERLGIEYYDRDIVEEISKQMNLPVSTISQLEERYSSPSFFNMVFPLGFSTAQKQDQTFDVQTKIINELVEKQSCIIVGRCSDYLMRDHPCQLNIYIYSSYENRLKNCIERLNMNEDEARKMIQEVDKARDNYHKRFANGTLPSDLIYKDILIDSNLFGIEGTADYLADIVKRKFLDE